MRSTVLDTLPSKVKRSMVNFGASLALARRKRGFTVSMMAERTGVSKSTYTRVEKGDATVTLGIYAMALFVLGFPDVFGELIDPAHDQVGLMLDEERLPKRVRVKRPRNALPSSSTSSSSRLPQRAKRPPS